MITLTRKEACAVLYISDSTLLRRTKAGQYTATRTGEGQFGKLSYTYEGLGLKEPTPEPVPEPTPVDVHVPVVPEPVAEPTFAPRELSGWEKKLADDEKFAADFLSGKESDSCGNFYDERKTCSLLGPRSEESSAPMESQGHMNPALLGINDTLGNAMDCGHNPIDHAPEGRTGRGLSLAPGMTQEKYDAMCQANRRGHNVRSLADQEIATRRGEQNIARSFPSSPKVKGPTVR